MRKRDFCLTTLFFMFGMIFSFSGCEKRDQTTDINHWQQKITKEREAKDKEFATSLTSPFAGLKRLTAPRNRTSYLIYTGGNYSLAESKKEGALISVSRKDGKWLWQSFTPEFKCRAGGKLVNPGDFPGSRTKAGYKRFSFDIYPLDEKLVIIVFDPEKEEMKSFRHLFYFPPDPAYRITAGLVRFDKMEHIQMITSRNLIKTFYRYAKILFTIKGQEKTLIAYKKEMGKGPGEAWLFIPFNDKTNGKATYAAGRFIEIKEPGSDRFILDFNEAFNPLCNYAHVYNCSYPPAENTLDIPIEAGKKEYPVKH